MNREERPKKYNKLGISQIVTFFPQIVIQIVIRTIDRSIRKTVNETIGEFEKSKSIVK